MNESERSIVRKPIILWWALAAFTLWDYYFGPFGEGFRVFDLLAVGLILSSLFTTMSLKRTAVAKSIRLPAVRWALLLALVSLFIASGLIGTARDPANFLRPTSGVWLGMIVFVVYYYVNVPCLSVDRVVGWLIILHALALFVQFAEYHSSGALINYQEISGAEPRVFSAIFRPSGLFLEPGSYAVTVIMLSLLRLIVRHKRDWISWIALVSVALTNSLFGVLAVCSILVFFFWKQAWFWLVACAMVLATILGMSAFSELPEVVFLTDRLLDFGSDVSVSARYGGMIDALQGNGDVLRLWFGGGLGNDYLFLGSSGVAFLVASVGIVGAALWLAIGMGLSSRGQRIRILFSLLLVLVAAPMWTTMFWWAWLGLMFNRSLAMSSRETSMM
jgi:hypothetical protein